MGNKSWKTSLAGLGMVLAGIGGFLGPYFDGDPSTDPNYQIVIGAIITGVGLMFAKDHNVTGGTKQQ